MKSDSNRLSRLAVIQTGYSLIITDQKKEHVLSLLNEMKENFATINELEVQREEINLNFSSKLLEYIFETEEALIQEIKLYLAKDWKYERLPIIMQMILKAAISELLCFTTPVKVVISEYTTIASGFLNDKETGFVNSLLQNISSKIRS
jgi:transcription antitermination factor NusB